MPQTPQQRIQKAIVLMRAAEKQLGHLSLADSPDLFGEAKRLYEHLGATLDLAKKLRVKFAE